MTFEITKVSDADKEALAELRIEAMRESLENIGRFDRDRARSRFLNEFSAVDTRKVMVNRALVGFFVVKNKNDHLLLDHIYICPRYQNRGIGSEILASIKNMASEINLPIRLGALRNSRSNDFYKKHGFNYTHDSEWDIYYEFSRSSAKAENIPIEDSK